MTRRHDVPGAVKVELSSTFPGLRQLRGSYGYMETRLYTNQFNYVIPEGKRDKNKACTEPGGVLQLARLPGCDVRSRNEWE